MNKVFYIIPTCYFGEPDYRPQTYISVLRDPEEPKYKEWCAGNSRFSVDIDKVAKLNKDLEVRSIEMKHSTKIIMKNREAAETYWWGLKHSGWKGGD